MSVHSSIHRSIDWCIYSHPTSQVVNTVDPCIWSAEVISGKGDCVDLAGCFIDSLTARRGKGKRAMNLCLVQESHLRHKASWWNARNKLCFSLLGALRYFLTAGPCTKFFVCINSLSFTIVLWNKVLLFSSILLTGKKPGREMLTN